MRTRTLLTTPPSQTPVSDEPSAEERREVYSRGLALPTEPKVPGKHRKLKIVLLTLAGLALIGWLVLRVLLAGQFQDPALTDTPASGDGTFQEGEQDPTLQLPGEDVPASEPTG